MNLTACVIMGRFMGLKTVDECISNYYLHYLPVIPYTDIEEDSQELCNDIIKYENGNLKLDWEYIENEVERQQKEYEDYCNRQYDVYDL